jgi:hypothetical protein
VQEQLLPGLILGLEVQPPIPGLAIRGELKSWWMDWWTTIPTTSMMLPSRRASFRGVLAAENFGEGIYENLQGFRQWLEFKA